MATQKIKLNKEQKNRYENLKLTIELVPTPCWWSNVRSQLTRKQWDDLRAIVFEKAKHKCEICDGIGTKHPVECHEVWHYDDKKKIQTLKKFLSICPLCHQVKHIGNTARIGQEYGERAYKRYIDINGLSDKDAEIFHSYTWQEWKERSRTEWKMDISLLSTYLDIEKTKYSSVDRKLFAKK